MEEKKNSSFTMKKSQEKPFLDSLIINLPALPVRTNQSCKQFHATPSCALLSLVDVNVNVQKLKLINKFYFII